MDTNEDKEFSTEAKDVITQMVTLIKDQAHEIEELKNKLEKCKMEDLTEFYSPECPTEDIPFEGKYDFYEE